MLAARAVAPGFNEYVPVRETFALHDANIRLEDQSEAIKRPVNRMCGCHGTRANVANKHFIQWTVKRIRQIRLSRS